MEHGTWAAHLPLTKEKYQHTLDMLLLIFLASPIAHEAMGVGTYIPEYSSKSAAT